MMEGLTGFDYVVLTIVGLFFVVGLLRGLVTEALSLLAWGAAVIAVRLFHEPLTGYLTPQTGGEPSAAIVAFLLLFFGTVLLGRVLAGLAGRASKASVIGPFDRVLGGAFGAAKGGILATVLFMLAVFMTGFFDAERESPAWLTQSKSAPALSAAAGVMISWLEAAQVEVPAGFPGLPDDHPPIGPFAEDPEGLEPAEPAYTPEDNQRLEELIRKGEAVAL
jgi:membrane protein required for colicin V production